MIHRFHRNISIVKKLRKSFLWCCFLFLTVSLNVYLTQQGKASYYSNKFNGRKTSSGEIYSKDSLTAAHKTLPFGTIIKVTNLSNDSIVYLKVNDRMGKNTGRILDVSMAGAKQLNFIQKGVTTVQIETKNETN
jgi:rare lipoprotein A